MNKIVLVLFLLCSFWSCEYNLERTNSRDINSENYNPHVPTVTTAPPINISVNSADIGGSVSFDGNSKIISRGICFGPNINPTISDNKVLTGGDLGDFGVNLSGLAPNTNYNARAFATNSAGTGYGNNVPFTTYAVVDRDGNFYHGVLIGTQLWMRENLKTTKFNDGENIPFVTDNATWSNLSTPGYCWYNNDVGFKDTYGALYNWYAVSTGKLCPAGWHVPSDAEWTTLTTSLGGESVAGGKLKEAGLAHWASPNTGATNEAGFTALPGGYHDTDGAFYNIGTLGSWWSATEFDASIAWYRNLSNVTSSVFRGNYYEKNGFSIRCLKD